MNITIINIYTRKTAICSNAPIPSITRDRKNKNSACFFTKNKFFLHSILTGSVIVTQLSSNAGIPVDELCGLRQIAFSWALRKITKTLSTDESRLFQTK